MFCRSQQKEAPLSPLPSVQSNYSSSQPQSICSSQSCLPGAAFVLASIPHSPRSPAWRLRGVSASRGRQPKCPPSVHLSPSPASPHSILSGAQDPTTAVLVSPGHPKRGMGCGNEPLCRSESPGWDRRTDPEQGWGEHVEEKPGLTRSANHQPPTGMPPLWTPLPR